MKKMILILMAVAVSSVGFLLGRASGKTSLAEGEQGQAPVAPVNCSIQKTNGTLKGLTGSEPDVLMAFEDSAGTIRLMNTRCSVVYKFGRQ